MTKKVTTVLALGVFCLALTAGRAWADPNTSNDTASFSVKITPNVDLGVEVDTAGAAWQGDNDLYTTMNLSGQSLLGTAVKVTVKGDFQVQEVELLGTAQNTWTLDTDETATQDQLRLYALLGADQSATVPIGGDYSGTANLITAGSVRVGQPQASEGGDTNHYFEFGTGDAEYADVDNMAVDTIRRLWMRANTPPSTTTDAEQEFVITVTAATGAGF